MKKIVIVLVLLVNSSIIKGEDCSQGYCTITGGVNHGCSGGHCTFYGGMQNSCMGGYCTFKSGPVQVYTPCGNTVILQGIDPCYICRGGSCS